MRIREVERCWGLWLPFLIAYPPSSVSSSSNLCANAQRRTRPLGHTAVWGGAGFGAGGSGRGWRLWINSSRTTVSRGARSIRRVALTHFATRVC